MLAVIAATFFAVLITILVLRNHKKDDRQLFAPRDLSVTLGVQIVCGDCAGTGIQPKRTILTRFGVCEQCGGTSYVLASEWAMMRKLAQLRAETTEKSGLAARVLSFDRATVTDFNRREKVAV
jgi:hypothetical protein